MEQLTVGSGEGLAGAVRTGLRLVQTEDFNDELT